MNYSTTTFHNAFVVTAVCSFTIPSLIPFRVVVSTVRCAKMIRSEAVYMEFFVVCFLIHVSLFRGDREGKQNAKQLN